jgi:hypothetical protein
MDMADRKGRQSDLQGAECGLFCKDDVLVDEFCSLVAEIAARSLTRRLREPDNGASSESRR